MSLTTRQHRLKDFLKDNFISGRYFSIEEMVEGVRYTDGTQCYKLNTDPKCHDKCIELGNDIRTINWELTDGWKIIIKNAQGGAKLAENREEFDAWWNKQHDAIETKYQYLNTLKSKADLDNSIPLYKQSLNPNKDNTPIDSFMKRTLVELALINNTEHKITIVVCDSVKVIDGEAHIVGGRNDGKVISRIDRVCVPQRLSYIHYEENEVIKI